MSQDVLAKAAGVGLAMVVHAELMDRPLMPVGSTAALRAALGARGIKFLWGNGGTGAQLR